MSTQISILNGPNLNLLGQREPERYGASTLADIQARCEDKAQAIGYALAFHQSNHEGELVDLIQQAPKHSAGIIINAGAYTHTSVAIHDALKAIALPVIELHITNVFSREPFRHHSYISPVASAVMCGFGAQGYELALEGMRALLNESQGGAS